MKTLISKYGLQQYYLNEYPSEVRRIKEKNKFNEVKLTILNISGDACESLIYHLIKDKIIIIPGIGEIKSIELRGDSNEEDDDNRGDIVIINTNNIVFIIEVKSFTSKNGFTSKSKSNKNADYWIICDFSRIRNGESYLQIKIEKNAENKYSAHHIETNGENKMYLKSSNISNSIIFENFDLRSYFGGNQSKPYGLKINDWNEELNITHFFSE